MTDAMFTTAWESERQRTAISRAALSMPVRQALNDGLLDDARVLDYGCGRGQDVRRLRAIGVDAQGWDPYFSPGTAPAPSECVLLSYVLNVIESPEERRRVLETAWGLARRILVVSTRLTWERHKVNGETLHDGRLSSRGTFQHLFKPQELRALVADTTGGATMFPSPGIVYVFREERDRMAALARRTLPTFAWEHTEDYAEAIRSVADFYQTRGRVPAFDELPAGHVSLLARTSISAIRRAVQHVADPDLVAEGARRTTLNTLLLLGIALFEGRPQLTELPDPVQADVRTFFSSYRDACRRADRLLLKLRDDAYLRAVMRNSPGKLTPSVLYVHRSAVEHTPVLLRLYEHCAAVAAGRPQEWTLLKLHHVHRKVSWLGYPSFDRDPHPQLEWSYLVDLRSLSTAWRDYRESTNRPLLHRKHEFLAADHPDAEKYRRLTRSEVRAGLYRHPELIGTTSGWQAELDAAQVRLRGHRLVRHPAR